MPIESALWKRLVKGILERMADEQYQRLAWFNKHEEVSSPDELICQLYDDHNIHNFIESPEIGLTSSQTASARAFLTELSEFCRQTPTSLDPKSTIDDPRWGSIRDAARSLLKSIFPDSPMV
jgi:hypothetical protein